MRTAAVALTLALLAGACAPGDQAAGIDAGAERRPGDGLLVRPELQEVVELQAARDAGGLRARLSSPDPAVRARAAFALASIPRSGAGPDLVALLDDPDAGVRADVAFALGQLRQLGGQQSLVLGRLTSERDPIVRRLLIEALGKQGGVEAGEALFALTGDEVVDEATLALSRLAVRGVQPVGVLDTLVARLTHPDPTVRRNAAWFFDRYEDPLVWIGQRPRLLRALDGYALDEAAARHLLDAMGGQLDAFALPRLLRFARWGSDWRVRAQAVGGLASAGFGDARSAALLRALDDPSPLVRLQAALVIADEPPIGLLMQGSARALEGRIEPAVTGPLLGFLAKVSEKEPVLARVEATPLDDEREWVGLIAALLAMPGEEALPPLARAAGAPSSLVADAAAEALIERWDVALDLPATYAGFRRWLGEAQQNALRAGHEDAAVLLGWALDSPELGGTGTLPRPGRVAVEGADAAAATAVAGDLRAVPPPDWSLLASLGTGPRLVLETERGRIVAVLDTESAPLTVQALARNVGAGLYDGLPFHRVIPDFVAQVGDPSLADDERAAPFPGAPGRSELTRLRFGTAAGEDARVLGMARTTDYDTEGSQFFITHSSQMHLDGGYTAFGWVIEGVEVVDRIQPGDRLLRVRVLSGAMPE